MENKKKNDEPKVKAICGLLHKNTEQRDMAHTELHYAKIKLRESKEGHIATLGRIVKYEGQPIINEALDYARKNGVFINCNSKYVGFKTIVKDYTTKSKKTYKAHFTHYDKFLEKCGAEDTEPKDYTGYFLYAEVFNELEKHRNNSVISFTKIEDLFNF